METQKNILYDLVYNFNLKSIQSFYEQNLVFCSYLWL